MDSIINEFRGKKILVIGDLMLDRSIYGDVSRISPEAPVPIVHATTQSAIPGGAANTANNLKTLGAEVFIAGVTGDDADGRELLKKLDDAGIDTEGTVTEAKRPTTLKTRVFSLNQQMIRIDRECKREIDEETSKRIRDYIESVAGAVDGIIVSDYGKGVVTDDILIDVSKIDKIPVVVDPSRENFLNYRNITAFITSQRDACDVLGIPVKNETSLRNMGYKLVSNLACEGVVITRGKEGLVVFEKNGNLTSVPSIPLDVYDITGVSDTISASYTISLAAGASLVEAGKIANLAGHVVVGKVGTATASVGEILEVLREHPQE